jgi:Zn-dependent peptidase ImmA (M78 family)
MSDAMSVEALQPSEIVAEFITVTPVDVGRLAATLGLKVTYDRLGEISGKIEKDQFGYKVTINETDPIVRKRFTLAHEIGHYILHRDLIGDGITDDAMYRSKLSSFYEIQANRYAAHILMPPGIFREKYRNGMTSPHALATYFGVSSQAAEYRIKNLGLG